MLWIETIISPWYPAIFDSLRSPQMREITFPVRFGWKQPIAEVKQALDRVRWDMIDDVLADPCYQGLETFVVEADRGGPRDEMLRELGKELRKLMPKLAARKGNVLKLLVIL